MFERFLKHWVKEVPLALHAIVILVISIPLFNFAVQPVLVSIDPMFAEQHVPLSQRSRLAPDTPGEIALVGFALILSTLYIIIKREIEVEYFGNDS